MVGTLFLITACGGMFSADGKIDSASTQKTVLTFQSLEHKYRPRSSFNFIEHKIDVAPQILKTCAVGEIDMVKASYDCGRRDPLLLTIKDNETEKVIKRVEPGSGQSGIDNLGLAVQSIRTKGENLDIFICLDSNGNGSCADEGIQNLNQTSVNIVREGNQSACANLEKGTVLYHHYEKLADTSGTTYVVALQYDSISEEAQMSLQNLDTTPVQTTGPEPSPNFPIRLTQSDPGACPPAPRTDGCFAKGTEIQLPAGKTAKIETLNGNDVVLLADGRSALIEKIVVGPEAEPMVTFETTNGKSVTVTSKHPMMTERGLVKAQDVKISDKLLTAKAGEFVALSSVRRHITKDQVYNFELKGGKRDEDHLVIANGLATGELFLQKRLSLKSPSPALASRK